VYGCRRQKCKSSSKLIASAVGKRKGTPLQWPDPLVRFLPGLVYVTISNVMPFHGVLELASTLLASYRKVLSLNIDNLTCGFPSDRASLVWMWVMPRPCLLARCRWSSLMVGYARRRFLFCCGVLFLFLSLPQRPPGRPAATVNCKKMLLGAVMSKQQETLQSHNKHINRPPDAQHRLSYAQTVARNRPAPPPAASLAPEPCPLTHDRAHCVVLNCPQPVLSVAEVARALHEIFPGRAQFLAVEKSDKRAMSSSSPVTTLSPLQNWPLPKFTFKFAANSVTGRAWSRDSTMTCPCGHVTEI
jgi:hypothetical protein